LRGWRPRQPRPTFQSRGGLGGNGILLENHAIRHMADIEAIHT
jgi:hypothetical protein